MVLVKLTYNFCWRWKVIQILETESKTYILITYFFCIFCKTKKGVTYEITHFFRLEYEKRKIYNSLPNKKRRERDKNKRIRSTIQFNPHSQIHSKIVHLNLEINNNDNDYDSHLKGKRPDIAHFGWFFLLHKLRLSQRVNRSSLRILNTIHLPLLFSLPLSFSSLLFIPSFIFFHINNKYHNNLIVSKTQTWWRSLHTCKY